MQYCAELHTCTSGGTIICILQVAYIQCLLDAVVVVGVKEAVDFLRLVATEEVDVALDHVRWSARLLSAGLSVWRERERERE